MRADRLVATLLILQARGRVTAAELAEELEISERTARRDLEALAMAGIPVYSQPGRNGGWSLLGGARTDLSGLTAAEARTLFLVAGPSSAVTPEAKAALRKLVRALPETFRAEAEAAAAAVVLDPTTWGTTSAPRPPYLDAIQEAVVKGVQVRLAYADRGGNETERTVHPLGLVAKSSVWYLVADTEAGMRTFRVGRVRGLTMTDRPVVRPDGFDLAETWRAVVEAMDERRTAFRAVVRAEPRAMGWLRSAFGSSVVVQDTLDDGRLEVEIGAWSSEALAHDLVGFGGHVEVVRPVEVRDQMARIGEELVARYGPTGPPPAEAAAAADPPAGRPAG
ncbi:MAG TPA: YafY family protein [Acidimicrobiales bacterium]|nr:YafY family protein [Acidimicrobiales bacterium]